MRQHNKEKKRKKFCFAHLRLSEMCLFSSSQAPSNDDRLIRRPGSSQCPNAPRSAHCLSRQKPLAGCCEQSRCQMEFSVNKEQAYCIHVNIFHCTPLQAQPALTVASRSGASPETHLSGCGGGGGGGTHLEDSEEKGSRAVRRMAAKSENSCTVLYYRPTALSCTAHIPPPLSLHHCAPLF